MAKIRLSIPLGLALAISQPAWGQPSSPLDANRVDRQQPTVPDPSESRERSPALPGAAAKVETDEASAPDIRKIAFVGTQVPEVVAESVQPFVGKPATRSNLKALTDAMTEAYGRSNVALFTIVIPRQDFAGGMLKVYVAEGYVQGVVLKGEVENRKLKLVKAYADKLTREKPTSRARLERYLSLIRDIPGLKVDAGMELGQGTGAVRLVLNLDYQRPRFTLGLTNRTSSVVKDGQVEAKGMAYSTFREGDVTEVNGLASFNFKDQLYFGLSHSTPVGTEGGRLGLAYGHLKTRPRDTVISGDADTLGLTYSYPLIRGYRRNMTLTASLDGVNSRNAAFGSVIASERTRAARVAVGYSFSGKRRVLNGGLTLSKGLDVFGARTAGGISDGTFLKANARAGVNQAIGKQAVLRLNGSGQWTRDPLPAVERFSVGGDPYGRAFEDSLISADRGVAGSAELAFRPLRKGPLAPTELYGFVDYAAVRLLPRPGFTGRDFDLGSAGGGVRLGYRDNAMLGLEVANTIDSPYPGYASEWRFSVSWRVSFKP